MKMNGVCKEMDTYFQLMQIFMLLFCEKIQVGILVVVLQNVLLDKLISIYPKMSRLYSHSN